MIDAERLLLLLLFEPNIAGGTAYGGIAHGWCRCSRDSSSRSGIIIHGQEITGGRDEGVVVSIVLLLLLCLHIAAAGRLETGWHLERITDD